MGLKTLTGKKAAAEAVQPTLRAVPFVKDASPKALKEAEKDARWFGLPGGWKLFDIGDASDTIYFVLSGSMGAFRRNPSGQLELVGHIRAGEPVGEMSLLAGEPHELAVYALRDTELMAMSRSGFMQLVRSEPQILERLTRVIMVRMRQARRKTGRTAEPKVFGLLATSPTIDMRLRARTLANALQVMGLRVAIAGEEAVGMPAGFFDELETRNDVVLYVSSIGDNPWFRHVQRHSDRLMLFARSDARPSVPLLPEESSATRQFRLVDVVLLHHGGTRPAADALDWKRAAEASRIFHWRDINDDDAKRLARIIAGRSVGLVLSGGGARAYAHMGVMYALKEAGCPIDFIGGASMGAVLGACLAAGWSLEDIDRRIRKAFVETNPLSDYGLPVVSLVKGNKVDARLRENFGELMIEDLPIPFFAVSTNLTTGSFRVHSEGRLRDALRASISLPGILPPIVVEGQVLVDGAVLNNFPVDVMRNMHRGRIIGVDVAEPPVGLSPDEFIRPPSFFGWTSRHGFKSPPPIANLLMRAATISVNPNAHRDLTDLLIVPDPPGVELRDWKEYDPAVKAGYDSAVKALSELRGPLNSIIRGTPAPAEAALAD